MNTIKGQVHLIETSEDNPTKVQITKMPQKGKLVAHVAGGEFRRYISLGFKSQHLYILSDEEIKAGYLAMNMYNNTNTIFKITKVLADGYEGQKLNEPNIFYGLSKTLKKIIATTDSSLKVFIDKAYMNFGETECLPQPSQSFIEKYVEKYNKGEQITEVMVEYENEQFDTSIFGGKSEKLDLPILKLKVNPKDNTITIKPVKENWDRSEVLRFLGEAFRLGKQVQRNPDYYSLCDPLADLAKKLL